MHPKIAQTHGYIAGLDISLLLCSQLPPKSFNGRDMPESSPQRYPTRILFHSNCHHTCICVGIGTQKPLKFTNIFVYFATFMLSTCDEVLQSLSYAGSKSSYVPHTYFVSQPPPSYVYSWSTRHPKITRIHGIISGLEDWQVWSLNLRQSASITERCRIQVLTGTPHILCL